MSSTFTPYAYHTSFPKYENNQEYRCCIRQVFQMNPSSYQSKIDKLQTYNQEELDAETEDELSFDEDAMKKGMDYIYSHTKQNPLFQKIYCQAAAKMISIDPEIGLAVCFSYDYFQEFHNCLMMYLENPDSFLETHNVFKQMILVLS